MTSQCVTAAWIGALSLLAACAVSESGSPLPPEIRGELQRGIQPIRAAAAHGDPKAEYRLALAYMHGAGVRHDDQKAVGWFRKAAEHGVARAETNLGAMYEFGWGVLPDPEESIRWYTRAAEHGEPAGQYNLGLMYAQGIGVPRDDVEAVKWYLAAAKQDYASAQYSLGFMTSEGMGTPKDQAAGFAWFTKAAEHGDGGAQWILGLSYFGRRRHEPQADVESLKWLTLALANLPSYETTVRERVNDYRVKLSAQMTPEKIAQAQALVDAWKRTPEPGDDQLGP